MPTIAGIDSFQHRIIPIAVNTATGWYAAINGAGTPPNHGGGGLTFDTANKRTSDHAVALKLATDGVTAMNIRQTIASTVVVGSIYFKVGTLVSSKLINCTLSTGTAQVQLNSNGTIQVKMGSGTGQSGTTNYNDGLWHRLDWKFDTSTGTATGDAMVDGITDPPTQATLALASANMTAVMVGDNTVATTGCVYYYSDLCWSHTAGDYPLGDHICLHLEINGTGTHNKSAGGFADQAGSVIDANLLAAVDDAWDGTTPNLTQTGEDYIVQPTVAGTEYVEFTFADTAQPGTVWGGVVGSLMAVLDSGTAANCETRLVDSGGATVGTTGLINVNASATGYGGYRGRTSMAAPSGGWSSTTLNGCKVRWGFSTDATPDVIFNSAILEYVAAWTPPSAGTTIPHVSMARTRV